MPSDARTLLEDPNTFHSGDDIDRVRELVGRALSRPSATVQRPELPANLDSMSAEDLIDWCVDHAIEYPGPIPDLSPGGNPHERAGFERQTRDIIMDEVANGDWPREPMIGPEDGYDDDPPDRTPPPSLGPEDAHLFQDDPEDRVPRHLPPGSRVENVHADVRTSLGLKSVTVHRDDGTSYVTSVNGAISDADIRKYFVGTTFTDEDGAGKETKWKCTKVDIAAPTSESDALLAAPTTVTFSGTPGQVRRDLKKAARAKRVTEGGGAGIGFKLTIRSFDASVAADGKVTAPKIMGHEWLEVEQFDAVGYDDGMRSVCGKLLTLSNPVLTDLEGVELPLENTTIYPQEPAKFMVFRGYVRGGAEGVFPQEVSVEVRVEDGYAKLGLTVNGTDKFKDFYAAVFEFNGEDDWDEDIWAWHHQDLKIEFGYRTGKNESKSKRALPAKTVSKGWKPKSDFFPSVKVRSKKVKRPAKAASNVTGDARRAWAKAGGDATPAERRNGGWATPELRKWAMSLRKQAVKESELPCAPFNRFEIEMPQDAVDDCSAQGQNDEAVAYWASKIARPSKATPVALAAELKEYGAWDADELADDDANWLRIVWSAAHNIKEEQYEQAKTGKRAESAAGLVDRLITEWDADDEAIERGDLEVGDEDERTAYEDMRSDLDSGECAVIQGHPSKPDEVLLNGKRLGCIGDNCEFADQAEALAALEVKMSADKYWPNIYYVNERGNVDLLDPTGKVVHSWV